MQFLILGYDGTDEDAQKRRAAVREEHIKQGDKLRDAGKLLYGVAMLNDSGKMCGSMLVGDFDSRDELDKWLEEEPYVTGKVWERIEVIPCNVGPQLSKLESLLAKWDKTDMALDDNDIEALRILFQGELEPLKEEMKERFDSIASQLDGLYRDNEKREQEYLFSNEQSKRLEERVDALEKKVA